MSVNVSPRVPFQLAIALFDAKLKCSELICVLGCLGVKYLVRHVGFQLTLTLGGRTLFRREISGSNSVILC